METAMKTAKVAPKAELTFDVDGTGTDGREGSSLGFIFFLKKSSLFP